MSDLWASDDPAAWRAALATYPAVIERQGVARLPALDRWFHDDLPALLAERTPAFITAEELARVTEWKMARGVWRQRNLLLVRSNPPEEVERVSRTALAAAPDHAAPIRTLAGLAGVGPATASAVASAARPDVYPFFDEIVAAQAPDLGPVAFTLGYYRRYAETLRARANRLGGDWTPARVERALWAAAGGKAGPATTSSNSS